MDAKPHCAGRRLSTWCSDFSLELDVGPAPSQSGTPGKSLQLTESQYTYVILALPASHYTAERIKHDSVTAFNVCLTLISCLIPAVTVNLERARS